MNDHIESWGRGIENIFEDCRKAKVPKPTYYVNPSDVMLKFTAPCDWARSFENYDIANGATNGVTKRVTKRATNRVTNGVTNRATNGATNEPESTLVPSVGSSKQAVMKDANLPTDGETVVLTLLQENPRRVIKRLSNN